MDDEAAGELPAVRHESPTREHGFVIGVRLVGLSVGTHPDARSSDAKHRRNLQQARFIPSFGRFAEVGARQHRRKDARESEGGSHSAATAFACGVTGGCQGCTGWM